MYFGRRSVEENHKNEGSFVSLSSQPVSQCLPSQPVIQPVALPANHSASLLLSFLILGSFRPLFLFLCLHERSQPEGKEESASQSIPLLPLPLLFYAYVKNLSQKEKMNQLFPSVGLFSAANQSVSQPFPWLPCPQVLLSSPFSSYA